MIELENILLRKKLIKTHHPIHISLFHIPQHWNEEISEKITRITRNKEMMLMRVKICQCVVSNE